MSAVLEVREPSARYLAEVRLALVRQFELLATSPGGVARLRELILTLAVQGKLVKQDPSAEPADRLLARVHVARGEQLASGRIGKQKPAEPIGESETSFPLPQGWAWSRVGDRHGRRRASPSSPPASMKSGEDYRSSGFEMSDQAKSQQLSSLASSGRSS